MSFGFSVSDIYGCAHLAYSFYRELREAPGACKEFSQELLLFSEVLSKTKDLRHSDKAALKACIDNCKELLYVQIGGASTVPKTNRLEVSEGVTFFRSLRQRFRERQFASQLPKFQRAISARIEKLTALNVLSIQ